MSSAIDTLNAAQQRAFATMPRVGGFPHLAETLRRAGVHRNVWHLPSCQSVYWLDAGVVVQQGEPLLAGLTDVPRFDETALIRVLRADQAGETSFPEFLRGAWQAGVLGYEVDFDDRTCTYWGAADERYVEAYPAVEV